jgi:Uncharacterized conserved protein
MSLALKLLIFCLGALFIIYVFRLLMKRRLSEKNSIGWLFVAVIVCVLSIAPHLLDWLSALCGISYPPALLFLIAILLLLSLCLHEHIQISQLSEQVKQLTQHIALSESGKDKETATKSLTL